MLRSEYVKFLAICNEELSQDFFLQTFESDKTYVNSFAKLRLNGIEYPEPTNKDLLYHKGICIDIFPLDHVPNNCLFRKIHRFKLMTLLSDMLDKIWLYNGNFHLERKSIPPWFTMLFKSTQQNSGDKNEGIFISKIQ